MALKAAMGGRGDAEDAAKFEMSTEMARRWWAGGGLLRGMEPCVIVGEWAGL